MNISGWSDERLKIVLAYVFGLAVLIVYLILSLVIGIGHIEEQTSFGLKDVLEGLKPLGTLFCGYAFGRTVASEKP